MATQTLRSGPRRVTIEGGTMATELQHRVTKLLQDPELFRERCYVGGHWIAAVNGTTIPVDDPATGDIIGSVPRAGRTETRSAIDHAAAALPEWRARTGKERAVVLRHWFDLVMANLEDLARLMTLEQGKPLVESRSEVAYGAAFLEWFGEEAKRAYGDTIPSHARDKRIMVIKQPVGVVGSITPWNFPIAMITRKVGPALAAGCTVVAKPASQTPFSALALAYLGERAGIPAGVFNVVTGSATEVGGELTSNPEVRKISFTGSTEVGKLLMAQCAGTMKKVSFELGGNAPFIVFDDADLDAAVEGAIVSKYRNTGQTCVCANRFLVQASIYDEFARRLSDAVGRLKVGSGLEEGVTQGPLIDMAAVEKVESHIQDAVAKGATVVRGGTRGVGPILCPHRLDRCHPRDGRRARGNLRPGCAALHIRDRRRRHRPRERHRIWVGGLLLRPRRAARLAGRRGARIRHRRRQHGPDFDGSGAIRRCERIRNWPRGFEIRPRGISRGEIHLFGWNLKRSKNVRM